MRQHSIGNFTIINQLGEGGMAAVYLAEHNALGHKVAIKVLAKEFLYNKGIKDRFIDEAKKMQRMDHPNVVKVTELINDGDNIAIVMEYVDGETLRDLLSKKKLNDYEIENYLKQMVSALDYVHKQGLVHRDIKPSNFIFNSEGILKLADFGISKNLSGELNEHTQTGTAMSMGTPMYMSPEQVRSSKDVTYLSDIYSLGVVLWEMAAGTKPYDLATLSTYDLMNKIVTESLPIIQPKWNWFIQKATHKNDTNRFKEVNEINFFIDNPEKYLYNHSEERTIISTTEKTIPIQDSKKRYSFLMLLGIILSMIVISVVLKNFNSPTEKSKDQFSAQNLKFGAIIFDIDKNRYKTIKIQNDLWMGEDLKVSHFQNGDDLRICSTDKEWFDACKQGEPSMRIIKKGNSEFTFYNWYALVDPRNLAPEGWVIPTIIDWNKINGDDFLKENNQDQYNCFDESGKLILEKNQIWWTIDKVDSLFVKGISIDGKSVSPTKNKNRMVGFNVRCIKRSNLHREEDPINIFSMTKLAPGVYSNYAELKDGLNWTNVERKVLSNNKSFRYAGKKHELNEWFSVSENLVSENFKKPEKFFYLINWGVNYPIKAYYSESFYESNYSSYYFNNVYEIEEFLNFPHSSFFGLNRWDKKMKVCKKNDKLVLDPKKQELKNILKWLEIKSDKVYDFTTLVGKNGITYSSISYFVSEYNLNSLLIESKNDVHDVLLKLNNEFFIIGLEQFPINYNNKPVFNLSLGVYETDRFEEGIVYFKDGKYFLGAFIQ